MSPDNIAAEYEAHVINLAEQHGVTIMWKEGTRGRAWRKSCKVRLAPIKSAISYAIALHELGHIVGPQPKQRLMREFCAWRWAKENALEWRKPMKKTAARCLASYLKWCKRRKGAWVPPPSHPVWQMAGMQPIN